MKTLLKEIHSVYDFKTPPTVERLRESTGLENLTPDIDISNRIIEEGSISRLSFPLTGFFDYFAYLRVQISGKNEYEYMKSLTKEVLTKRFQKIASYQVPCIIVSRNLPIEDYILDVCRKYGVPVLKSEKETLELESELVNNLRIMLAPVETIHGVLVDVYGVGMLIKGDSGIGKSEAALELIRRGHRLVSDDVVELHKVSDETIVGVAPDLTRDFLELRGIGIINIRTMFGYEALKESKNVEFIVNLEEYKKEKMYDRFGLETQFEDLMGRKTYKVDIPIRPGRNLAVILESAAVNYRSRQMGYDAPGEFMERIKKVKMRKLEKES